MVISDTFQNFANDKIVKCKHPTESVNIIYIIIENILVTMTYNYISVSGTVIYIKKRVF